MAKSIIWSIWFCNNNKQHSCSHLGVNINEIINRKKPLRAYALQSATMDHIHDIFHEMAKSASQTIVCAWSNLCDIPTILKSNTLQRFIRKMIPKMIHKSPSISIGNMFWFLVLDSNHTLLPAFFNRFFEIAFCNTISIVYYLLSVICDFCLLADKNFPPTVRHSGATVCGRNLSSHLLIIKIPVATLNTGMTTSGVGVVKMTSVSIFNQ